MIIIILKGSYKSKMSKLGNVRICIPSKNTQRIQEGHLLTEHILCEILEEKFIESNN